MDKANSLTIEKNMSIADSGILIFRMGLEKKSLTMEKHTKENFQEVSKKEMDLSGKMASMSSLEFFKTTKS